MNPSLATRAAVRDDEPFMFRVFASTREDELAILGWDDRQKADFLGMQFLAQSRSLRASYPRSRYEVILLGDRPVGRVLVDRGADQLHIVDIALLGEYRGRGIGCAVIESILREAGAANKPVSLYVERANRARRLYERLGFCPAGDHGLSIRMDWFPPVRNEPQASAAVF